MALYSCPLIIDAPEAFNMLGDDMEKDEINWDEIFFQGRDEDETLPTTSHTPPLHSSVPHRGDGEVDDSLGVNGPPHGDGEHPPSNVDQQSDEVISPSPPNQQMLSEILASHPRPNRMEQELDYQIVTPSPIDEPFLNTILSSASSTSPPVQTIDRYLEVLYSREGDPPAPYPRSFDPQQEQELFDRGLPFTHEQIEELNKVWPRMLPNAVDTCRACKAHFFQYEESQFNHCPQCIDMGILTFSEANNMDVGEVPQVLDDLSVIEASLIAQISPLVSVIHKHRFF